MNDKTVYSLAVNGNNIFAGVHQFGVHLSTNNGANWTQTDLYDQTVYSLAVNGNNIFAGTVMGVFRSLNNGTNWTQTSLNYLNVYSLAISGNNIFAGTGYNGVYLSTNNGNNWVQTALNNQFVYSLAISGNNIFAGTLSNGVYLSTNNGTNWSQTSLNNKSVKSLSVSGNNVFSGTDSNGVYFSANNGTNWIQKNQGFNGITSVYALLIANNYILAGTYQQSVWLRLYSEAIGINKITENVPSKYSLSQNYPNPFNPTTNIKFNIAKLSDVKIVVYDIMGREVQTLVNESLQPGIYEVSFDGSKLTSGVYFYRLISDNFTDTKRMLLVK